MKHPGIAAWLLVALSSLTTLACCSGCGDGGKASDAGTDGDGDADADTDTDTDTDADTEDNCIESGDIFDWQPLPEGYDCGPGCRQLTFEPIFSPAGWSSDGRFVACSTEVNYGNRAIIIDTQNECWSYVPHPKYENVYWQSSSSDEGSVAWTAYTYNEPIANHTMLLLNILEDEICLLKEMESNSQEEGPRFLKISIDDNVVAYNIRHYGTSHKDGQVFTLDLSNEETKPVSDADINSAKVLTDSGYVVWTDATDQTDIEIYAHRISTSTTWNMTDHPSDQFTPQMDGTRVVWTDLRNGDGEYWGSYENADIYMYDFANDSLTRITDGEWVKYRPDISGDRVVWQDYRACDQPNNVEDFSQVDIWMHDLSTGEDLQITNLDGSESQPLIAGGKVFFFKRVPNEPLFALFVQELSALGL